MFVSISYEYARRLIMKVLVLADNSLVIKLEPDEVRQQIETIGALNKIFNDTDVARDLIVVLDVVVGHTRPIN